MAEPANSTSPNDSPPRSFAEKAKDAARNSPIGRAFFVHRARIDALSAADKASRSTANATWTIASLTFATILLGFLQFIVLGRQLEILKGQLDEMAADQRPWLSIDVDHYTDLKWNQNGSYISITFNVKNVGKSPAAKAMFYFKAVYPPVTKDTNLNYETKAIAAEIEAEKKFGDSGEYFFPGQVYQETRNYEYSSFLFETYMKDAKENRVIPRAIACVKYFAGDRLALTCTSFFIRLKDDSPGMQRGFTLNQPVPVDKIEVVRAFSTAK